MMDEITEQSVRECYTQWGWNKRMNCSCGVSHSSAWIWSLTWELPFAGGAAAKKKRRRKENPCIFLRELNFQTLKLFSFSYFLPLTLQKKGTSEAIPDSTLSYGKRPFQHKETNQNIDEVAKKAMTPMTRIFTSKVVYSPSISTKLGTWSAC